MKQLLTVLTTDANMCSRKASETCEQDTEVHMETITNLFVKPERI